MYSYWKHPSPWCRNSRMRRTGSGEIANRAECPTSYRSGGRSADVLELARGELVVSDRVFRIEKRGGTGDRNRLAGGAQFQADVQHGGRAGRQDNVVLHLGLESLRGD